VDRDQIRTPHDPRGVIQRPMARDRWLRRRWLIWLVITWSVALASAPHLGDAAPLPPARDGGAAGDLDDVRALLEHRLVREQLAALGVSEAEAAELWQRLTPAEREELAGRADELRAGGDPVAAGVAIAIIVAMAVILALELIGRRIISRPSTGAQP
jgi:uncharacterized protein DUF6627